MTQLFQKKDATCLCAGPWVSIGKDLSSYIPLYRELVDEPPSTFIDQHPQTSTNLNGLGMVGTPLFTPNLFPRSSPVSIFRCSATFSSAPPPFLAIASTGQDNKTMLTGSGCAVDRLKMQKTILKMKSYKCLYRTLFS